MSQRLDIDSSLPKALRRIYAEVPPSTCKGLCQAACAHVPCQQLELDNIKRVAGDPPQVGKACRYLSDTGRCQGYAARPILCRIWGQTSGVATLGCPHGCHPTLSRNKASELLQRVVELDPEIRSLDPELDAVIKFGGS